MRARMGQELPFPRAEHDRRIARARAAMAADGLDAVLLFDPENIFYLTGYQSIGYFTFQALLLPAGAAPVLISRSVNRYMAAITPTIGTFADIPDTADPVAVTLDALHAHGARGRLGVEAAAWYLTAPVYDRIRADAGWSVSDWSGVVERHRIVKTGAEIERMRQAARAAEAGLRAAFEAARPGATENDVAAAMHQAGIAAGSEYLGHAPLCTSGERTAVCFAMWRRRRLAAGDVLLLENAGCIDRYHAILARTAVLGAPTAEMRRMARAILDGLDAVIAAIRPGIASGAADRACRDAIAAAGYGDRFVHRVAYAVGIGFPPNWSEGKTLALRPDDPSLLEPGMTFHCVPTIFGGDFGMCFSETVLVTADGCEVLTDFPRELAVL